MHLREKDAEMLQDAILPDFIDGPQNGPYTLQILTLWTILGSKS